MIFIIVSIKTINLNFLPLFMCWFFPFFIPNFSYRINVPWKSMHLKMRVPFNIRLASKNWNNSHFARGCDSPITMATTQYLRTRVSTKSGIIDEQNRNKSHFSDGCRNSVCQRKYIYRTEPIRKKPFKFVYRVA